MLEICDFEKFEFTYEKINPLARYVKLVRNFIPTRTMLLVSDEREPPRSI
jgi:hypothetical protein